MTFDSLKENSSTENFETSALTEDSLRLALAKLGSKNDRKHQSSNKVSNPFASGNSRASNSPARRKFAREDSVVVEKLSSRISSVPSRSSEKVRSPFEEKPTQASPDNIQSLKQEVTALKQAQKRLGQRLSEVEAVLEQQTKLLAKYQAQQSSSQPSLKREEKSASGKVDIEIFPSTQERSPNEPMPVKLKEDADPVEWWKS